MHVMTWYTSINYIVDTLSVFLVLKLYCIVKRYKRTKNIAVTFFIKFESLTNSAIALIMLVYILKKKHTLLWNLKFCKVYVHHINP